MATTTSLTFYSFDTLGSTSDTCAHFLREGKASLPFAVFSQTQTIGRGQRGKSWTSPSGNIYLSIALDHGQDKAELAPLKAAIIVAEWIHSTLKVNVDLKWPNDIYLAGKKLAGILCETSYIKESFGPLIVGIGINVLAAPIMPEGNYSATCFSHERDEAWHPESLARNLADYFHSRFSSINQAAALFTQHRLGLMDLWHQNDRTFHLESLEESGFMTLTSVSGKHERLTCHSASDFTCAYLDPNFPLLCADIGNSSIKIGLFHGTHLSKALSFSLREFNQEPNTLQQAITSLLKEIPFNFDRWPIYVLSVNEKAQQALKTFLAAYGFTLQLIPKKTYRVWHSNYDLTQIGIDRLATMEAWLSTLPPAKRSEQAYSIIVNLGTATTIDWLRQDGYHLGGTILPGLDTALKSLHQATAKLPLTTWCEPPANPAIATNTEQALLHGAAQMTLGAISQAKQTIKQLYPDYSEISIITTGPPGQYFATKLDGHYEPFLTLKGAKILMVGG